MSDSALFRRVVDTNEPFLRQAVLVANEIPTEKEGAFIQFVLSAAAKLVSVAYRCNVDRDSLVYVLDRAYEFCRESSN